MRWKGERRNNWTKNNIHKGSCKWAAAFWKEGDAFTVPALVTKATTNKTSVCFWLLLSLWLLCPKHSSLKHSLNMSANIKSWMCISILDLWSCASQTWQQQTQPDLPLWYFLLMPWGELFKCVILWRRRSKKKTKDYNWRSENGAYAYREKHFCNFADLFNIQTYTKVTWKWVSIKLKWSIIGPL